MFRHTGHVIIMQSRNDERTLQEREMIGQLQNFLLINMRSFLGIQMASTMMTRSYIKWWIFIVFQ